MSTRARGAVALFAAARPKQWPKNLLVAIGAGATGRVLSTATFMLVAAFVAASAAVYLCNDVSDRELDRLDPEKAKRPIAAGTLHTGTAVTAALLLGGAAVLLAALGGAWWAVVAYLAMNVAYSGGLKRVPWVETLPVTAGFPLRVLAGAGTLVPAVLVVTPVAFAVVVAKRHGELLEGHRARPGAELYSIPVLVFLRRVSFAFAVTTNAATALSQTACTRCVVWTAVATIGLTAALLRFEIAATRTGAARPDQTARRDPVLLTGAALWAIGTVLA